MSVDRVEADSTETGADAAHERALRRIGLPLAKFWVCKRTPMHVNVEESGLPLLFRESPLNSVWEGSGTVNALDVLRTVAAVAGAGLARLSRGPDAG